MAAAQFISHVAGTRISMQSLAAGREGFYRLSGNMKSARLAFRKTWDSRYAGHDWRKMGSDVKARLAITSKAAYSRAKTHCESSPGDYWAPVAMNELHWFHQPSNAWLRKSDEGRWEGWSAADASPASLGPDVEWIPWASAMDATDAPYVRWFGGGLTNAAFNELDRHVLAGYGTEVALIAEPSFEGEPSRAEPLEITRRQLLLDSVLAAHALGAQLGVTAAARVGFYLPNSPAAIAWVEGAKRIGAPFMAVAAGTSSSTLHDRIGDRQQDLCELDHGAFEEERNNNNNLFKKVRFNREMVNDGDILVQLSEAAMKRAGKLAKNVSQYSAADIGKALSQDFTKAGGDMDWVALGAQCGLCLVLTHAPSPVGTSFAPMMAAAGGFSPTAPALVRRSAAVMSLASTDDIATAPPSVGRIDVGVEGVREMTTDQKAYLAELLDKCSNPNMQEVWRRAAFWENETASLLEIVNVLGRWERCSEWKDRTIFIDETDLRAKDEDERQALTTGRHQMALRLGCGERSAMFQNVPNLQIGRASCRERV